MTTFLSCLRLLLFTGLLLTGCNFKDQPVLFDPVIWRQGDQSLRFEMKEDLLKNYKEKIVGHHKNDVLKLLGPADLDAGYPNNAFIMIYGIGTVDTWDQCPCNLDILYDSSGYVFDMSARDM